MEKKQRRTLCIIIRDNKAVLSGDAESVAFAENNTDMTVKQLMDGILNMDSEALEFKFKLYSLTCLLNSEVADGI